MRIGDLGTLIRLYRGQPPESRALYHPFPFDRVRCSLVFFLLFVMTRVARPGLRLSVRAARILLVATIPDRSVPVGYGTISFGWSTLGVRRSFFGYMVDPEFRRIGVSKTLHIAMIERSLRLGVTRGGGIVLKENVANRRAIESLGFALTPGGAVDRHAPTGDNFITEMDLEAIARQWRSAPPTASAPSPSPAVVTS